MTCTSAQTRFIHGLTPETILYSIQEDDGVRDKAEPPMQLGCGTICRAMETRHESNCLVVVCFVFFDGVLSSAAGAIAARGVAGGDYAWGAGAAVGGVAEGDAGGEGDDWDGGGTFAVCG